MIGTTAGIILAERYRAPGLSPSQIIATVNANPPHGTTSIEPDSSGVAGQTTSLGTMFTLRDLRGVLDERILWVTAYEAPGGASVVSVLAESVWVVPYTPGVSLQVGAYLSALDRILGVRLPVS